MGIQLLLYNKNLDASSYWLLGHVQMTILLVDTDCDRTQELYSFEVLSIKLFSCQYMGESTSDYESNR